MIAAMVLPVANGHVNNPGLIKTKIEVNIVLRAVTSENYLVVRAIAACGCHGSHYKKHCELPQALPFVLPERR
jgi:hypothetical protein